MKKKENKIYYPTDYEHKCYLECIKNYDLAISLNRINQTEELYYLVKYKVSSPKKFDYIKLDSRYVDTPSNRLRLNRYEADKKMFELYRKAYEHFTNSKKNEKTIKRPKIKTFAKQIDLLEMIDEVERENDVS